MISARRIINGKEREFNGDLREVLENRIRKHQRTTRECEGGMVEISRSRNMSLMQSIRDGTEPERGLGAVSQRCIYGSNLLRCSEFLKGKEMVVSSVKGRDYFAGRSLNEIRICRREWKFSRIESELNEKERETRV